MFILRVTLDENISLRFILFLEVMLIIMLSGVSLELNKVKKINQTRAKIHLVNTRHCSLCNVVLFHNVNFLDLVT